MNEIDTKRGALEYKMGRLEPPPPLCQMIKGSKYMAFGECHNNDDLAYRQHWPSDLVQRKKEINLSIFFSQQLVYRRSPFVFRKSSENWR